MPSTIKKQSPVLAEITIDVEGAELNRAVEKGLAEVRRYATIKGFRQGKAPLHLVTRLYGEVVRRDAERELISARTYAALKEHDVDPLGPPEAGETEALPDGGFRFTVRIEMRPTLEQITYEGVEVTRQRPAVAAADIDREVDRLRETQAVGVELPSPRPAEKGDLVICSLSRWRDGEWKPFAPGRDELEIVPGLGRFAPGLEEGIVGMAVGEEKVIDLGSPETPESERVRFQARVNAVKGRKLPEADDEFAKDVGFESLAELRTRIEERQRQGQERQLNERFEEAVWDALRARNPLEIPPGIRRRQAVGMERQTRRTLAMMGAPVDESEAIEPSEAALEQAGVVLHRHLLLLEIARHEKIEVVDADLDAELERIAAETRYPLPRVRAEFGGEERREELRFQVLGKKVVDFVSTRIKISEVDGPQPEAAE